MMSSGSVDRVNHAVALKLEALGREMQQAFHGKGYISITLMPGGRVHCSHEVGGPDDDVQFVNVDIEASGKQAVVSQC